MARLRSLLQSGELDDEEAAVASYAWREFWARDAQIAPPGDWSIWLLLAGRGFGKTRTGVEWLREKAEAGIGPLALIGRTAADVRDVLIEGPAGVMACAPPWARPVYEPSKRRLTWPNGVTCTTYSADQPDQLRGPQHAAALADEIAAWQYFDEAWSNLMLGLRLGALPQVCAATTPRPLPMIRELMADADCVVTRGRTIDNAANLARKAVEYLHSKYGGTRLGRQELEGELLDDLPGALWTRAMIEAARSKPGQSFAPNDFERVVVAIDPSGSDGDDDGDEQGIVVAGKLRGREHFVVLEDTTAQRSPEQWATHAVGRFDDWGADAIVAEKNYGGDMVRAVIQQGNASIPVKVVTASRGKVARAEPVSRLYEQGKVTHAAAFTGLEDELCQFTSSGYKGGSSPNRADAAIWAITDLAGLWFPEPSIRSL